MVLEVRVMLGALYAAIYWATETAIFSGTLFISLVVAGGSWSSLRYRVDKNNTADSTLHPLYIFNLSDPCVHLAGLKYLDYI